MLVVHYVVALFLEDLGEHQPVGHVPHPLDDLVRHHGFRAGVRQVVELAVQPEELGCVGGTGHLLGEFVHAVEGVGGEAGQACAQQQRLDLLADAVELLAFVEIELRHSRTGVRDELYQAVGFQNAERSAHRNPARAVLLGYVFLQAELEIAISNLGSYGIERDAAAGRRR
nr:hypothetical protein [Amycolatopsis jejuensis]